jgi:hypothetical protein
MLLVTTRDHSQTWRPSRTASRSTAPTTMTSPYSRSVHDELECKDMCSRSWDHFVRTSLRELAEGGPGAPNRSPRDLARRAAEQQA